jgi:hypothetical protein
MKTATRGNIGEAHVLGGLVDLGLHVLVPFGSGHPYDLVVELPSGAFLRVQVKTGWAVGGCVIFHARATDHGNGKRRYHGLAELFAVYFPQGPGIYLVPVDAIPGHDGRLRLEPTKNNQRIGVRQAADFEIGTWDIARLEELADSAQTRFAA